jgi:putative DNA primase/helicase
MIQLAESEPGIPIRPSDLDRDPWLFNCSNGTIDLHDGGRLRPHSRGDMITKVSPVAFDPDATHELWTSFLHDATGGDTEYAAYLQRMAGYALTGDTAEKKFFFAHGPTSTGKSAFIDALSTALGDYHVSADFDTWCTHSNVGGNRGDLVRLAGARLVTSVEVAKGKRFDETIMKRVTGGDEIVAAAKYEGEISFRPGFKIVLAANDAPRVRDDDDPLWSRLALLPFVNVVAAPDPTVKLRLRDPRALGPAILAWAVRGCLEWQANRLGQASVVNAASAAYRAEMDPLRDFFDEHCVFDPQGRLARKPLRLTYEMWVKESGVRFPLTAKEFAARLRDRGVEPCDIRTSEGTRSGWRGIRMRESWEGGT